MKDGEIGRNGSYLRWNLSPTQIHFQPPLLIVYDESQCQAEIRDGGSGEIRECVGWKDVKFFKTFGKGGGDSPRLLGFGPGGLVEVVEVGFSPFSRTKKSLKRRLMSRRLRFERLADLYAVF